MKEKRAPMAARRKVVIPPNVWQECRRSHRGQPPRCLGSYSDNPCDHPWMVRVSKGRKGDGRRSRSARAVATLDEAALLAAEIAATTPNANGYDPDIVLGDWMAAWYLLKQNQVDALSPTTLVNYATNISIWKADRIARVKLRNLTFTLINEALARMAEPQSRPAPRELIDAAGRRRKRAAAHGRFVERRSANTLRGYQATLRAALSDARRFGLYVGENPARGTMPAIGEAKAAKIQRIDFAVPLSQRLRLDKWQPSQTARFLNAIAGHRLAVLWKLYATLGTRRGELAGVGWFSYEGNVIAIESRLLKLSGPQPCDLCPVEHVGVRWQPGAKSGNGIRTIFLPSQLVTAIADHKIAQAAERDARLAAGLPWWDHQLMFCQSDGSPLYPDGITAEFNRLVEACDLPKVRLHDLRHNVASLLLATGMPFSSVMKITGHDEDTLKKIYHHVVGEIVTPEMQNAYDWMEALQASEQAKAAANLLGQDATASVTAIRQRFASS